MEAGDGVTHRAQSIPATAHAWHGADELRYGHQLVSEVARRAWP